MKSVTIKLSLKQVRELEFLVEDLGIRKSGIIRRVIDEFFDRENLKKIKLRKLKVSMLINIINLHEIIDRITKTNRLL